MVASIVTEDFPCTISELSRLLLVTLMVTVGAVAGMTTVTLTLSLPMLLLFASTVYTVMVNVPDFTVDNSGP